MSAIAFTDGKELTAHRQLVILLVSMEWLSVQTFVSVMMAGEEEHVIFHSVLLAVEMVTAKMLSHVSVSQDGTVQVLQLLVILNTAPKKTPCVLNVKLSRLKELLLFSALNANRIII